jgi:hypothetical protein
MTPEAMNRLAENYTLSNGLVNYLLLFRNFLNDLTKNSSKRNIATLDLNQSQSASSLSNSLSLTNLNGTVHHDSGPVHPWEFSYKRERHPDHPYWHSATSLPKEAESQKAFQDSLKLTQLQSLSPNEKNMNSLLSATRDKELLLGQYPKPLLDLCHKCYNILSLNWRTLRNQFKKQQLLTQKGVILTTNFVSILEANGINLSKKEFGYIIKHFRGASTSQDIVRFDDFLRICMLTKDVSN